MDRQRVVVTKSSTQGMDQVPIDDIGGKEFWVEHFGPGKAVAWDVFVDYLKVQYHDST